MKGELVKCEGFTYDPKEGRDVKTIAYMLSENGPIGPNGLDIRIGGSFKRIKTESLGYLEAAKAKSYVPEVITSLPEGGIYLHSGEFCLATSEEYLMLPNDVMGMVDARSTIGRMGLIIQTATFIQAGYHGKITLELKNEAPVPILIRPYDIVGQIVFMRLDQPTSSPYRGQYQGQDTTTAPGEKM
jgi:dCTP deaminase